VFFENGRIFKKSIKATKFFPGGGGNGETSFYPIENKKTAFLLKM